MIRTKHGPLPTAPPRHRVLVVGTGEDGRPTHRWEWRTPAEIRCGDLVEGQGAVVAVGATEAAS